MRALTATRSRHGLLLDLVSLHRELRQRIEARETTGKPVQHLWVQFHRVRAAVAAGEFVEIN